jgi:hypothetical protein
MLPAESTGSRPSRWLRGSYLACDKGQDSLQLLWAAGGEAGKSADLYLFSRQFADHETSRSCHWSSVRRDYGSYYGSEF